MVFLGGLKTINTEKLPEIFCPYLPTIFFPFPSPSPLLPSSFPSPSPRLEPPQVVSLLTKWEDATITRKQWIYKNNKVFTQDNKEVIPKRELFQVLSHAHRRIAHRGRQITTKWLRENYAEVNQKVINIFVKMCKFHAEQKSVTSNVKLVKQPMQAPTFLHMIEIDLMDFRKCPCECIESHTWAMNITDHHTKHVTLSRTKSYGLTEPQ